MRKFWVNTCVNFLYNVLYIHIHSFVIVGIVVTRADVQSLRLDTSGLANGQTYETLLLKVNK